MKFKNILNKKYKLIFVFILITILLTTIICVFLYKKNIKDKFENYEGIPKIIHQTAPTDKSKWHNDWYKYQKSWQDLHPDYEYKLWNDEDLENLIKTKYEWFYDTYKNYDEHIKRVDSARYFILYEHGGIYADMDFECLKRFDDQLPPNKVSIAEDPNSVNLSYYQNALMCSPKHHKFWEIIFKKLEENKNKFVFEATGPTLITDGIHENPDLTHTLITKKFAPNLEYFNNDDVYTRHWQTGVWNPNHVQIFK
jgi:mannosyltransferase OCH1-like enzyme